uniref:Uncharacterized protein n=1 Tax=Trypanosoma vivax (strain Y486) TaxID=1055687 RepID=G0U4Z1_TRYVY|nr:conserved hypothetical protein [Trypanosoma vivax Y486]
MFGRRVVSCCPIPTSMYGALHISSKKQASRLVSPIISLLPSARRVMGKCNTTGTCITGELLSTDILSASLLLAATGVPTQQLLVCIASNPLLLRLISDTMCTYSVLFPHKQMQAQ